MEINEVAWMLNKEEFLIVGDNCWLKRVTTVNTDKVRNSIYFEWETKFAEQLSDKSLFVIKRTENNSEEKKNFVILLISMQIQRSTLKSQIWVRK